MRVTIAQHNADGTFTEINLEHSPGEDQLAQQLVTNYSDDLQLAHLMSGGDLKVLGNSPSESIRLGQPGDHLPAVEHADLSELLTASHGAECELVYVYMYGYWCVIDPVNRTHRLVEDMLEID